MSRAGAALWGSGKSRGLRNSNTGVQLPSGAKGERRGDKESSCFSKIDMR
jgi:hypothetical protein